MTMDKKSIVEIMKKEMVIALGCTEPAAIAYCAAAARDRAFEGEIKKITVNVSLNIIKNAMAVCIPGTNFHGVNYAAALGAVVRKSEKKLELLNGLDENSIKEAEELVKKGLVEVNEANSEKKLFIEVLLETTEKKARVIIEDQHTNITRVEVDGEVLFQKESLQEGPVDKEPEYKLTVDDVWDFAMNADLEDMEIVKEAILLNQKIGLEGLKNSYGLCVGKTMQECAIKGFLPDNFMNYTMALTAAGSDARMAGSMLPVMSNSGSGNQGITATLPIVAVAERLNLSEEKMIRGAALSNLMTIYIKSKFGRLSAYCGVSVAGTGASCGITYLLGGTKEQMEFAIQNMVGNVPGMLCDGAKAGCALKVSTCISAATQSAVLAIQGISIQATDGIIETEATKSVDNFCKLANEGSAVADRIILDTLLEKTRA